MKRKTITRVLLPILCALTLAGCGTKNGDVQIDTEVISTETTTTESETESESIILTTDIVENTTESETATETNQNTESSNEIVSKIKGFEIISADDEIFENIEENYISSPNYKLFEGTWNRTECESSYEGNLQIDNCTENEINIEGYFSSFANTGELYLTGKFITETDVIAFEEDMAVYLFSYEDGTLKVYQIGTGMYMGAGTSARGKFIQGKPNYTNADRLTTLFSEEDLEIIHQLFINANADEQLYFTLPFIEGLYEVEAGTAQFEGTSEEIEGTWMQAYIPHLGEGYTEIFISNDHKIFIRFKDQILSTEKNSIMWNHTFSYATTTTKSDGYDEKLDVIFQSIVGEYDDDVWLEHMFCIEETDEDGAHYAISSSELNPIYDTEVYEYNEQEIHFCKLNDYGNTYGYVLYLYDDHMELYNEDYETKEDGSLCGAASFSTRR